MTDDQRPADDGGAAEPIEPGTGRPAQGAGPPPLADLGDLLGPEAAETIGTVAEEAFKLFAVARERFGEAVAAAEERAADDEAEPPASGQGPAPSPWAGLLSQLAAGAVRAVEDFAAAAQQEWPEPESGQPAGHTHPVGGDREPPGERVGAAQPGSQGAGSEGPDEEQQGQVRPGEAAACSYCPICQGIALVRSVPPGTWQRLAVSVVEMADAARGVADAAEAVAHPEPGGASPANVVIRQEQAPEEDAGLGSVADFLRGLEPTEEPSGE